MSGNPDILPLQTCLRDIDAALRAGDGRTAMRLAAQGAAQGFAHPKILTLAAAERLAAKDGAAGLAYAQAACDLAPHDPDALNACGMALMAVGRTQEAIPAFDAALRRTPNAAGLHFRKAEALQYLGRLAQAEREYEQALVLQPVHPEARARLAILAATAGKADQAREHASRALQHNPLETAAELALAMADIEERNFGAARIRATKIIQDSKTVAINRSIAQHLLGDAEDGMGHWSEAFSAYTAANATARALYKPVFEAKGLETAIARTTRLKAYFRSANPGMWAARRNEAAADHMPQTHVFLVGFPRSGTTLLEQILTSHGDVVSMEERDCLSQAFDDFIMAEGGLARLAKLENRALDPWRKAYWEFAAASGFVPSRRVFIDKMPLNTVLLPLIAKLFPQATILFALRDPRDVVFSCFRRRFGMTAQMYQFLTLEGAARYYDAVMSLSEVYRPLLALDTQILKYEDIVADFEGTARMVCDCLGLEWNDSMRDFANKSRSRHINTPSAAQVAHGLYTSGQGQWRNYKAHLQPVLPLLAPWCERFGYEAE